GLFGGTQDARDDLIGGPDPDCLLSADDNDLDRAPEDALLHFVNWDRQWTDLEIETMDKGFAWLQLIRGNPALLKTEGENVITFERIGSLNGSLADNDSKGKIRVADAGFSNSITPDATIVHEIGHNWDTEMGGWFTDNWLPRSGWRPADNGGGSKFPPPGYLRSQDGQWDYLATAPFARTYGTTNAREDWSTAWEAYYVNLSYPFGDGARSNHNYTGMLPKFEVVAQFFAGLF
ncbi:MAG TPA: hypothetical protein VKE40_00260, partial [Gemmataceae bacterium]|nr:hypothetical protein [Gemmataceae bacterium]